MCVTYTGREAMSAPSGFRHIAGALDRKAQENLCLEIAEVLRSAPLYTPTMPRSGKPFSVRMTNCGPLGWVSDKSGYRYQQAQPVSGNPWPPMPEQLLGLWQEFTGFAAPPEACLVNWYGPKAKLGLHVDADEAETQAPVLSLSLGDDAWFRIGGLQRRDPTERILLKSGDIVVLGGEARLAYHGIDRIQPGTSDLLAEHGRFNLTLRRVNVVR